MKNEKVYAADRAPCSRFSLKVCLSIVGITVFLSLLIAIVNYRLLRLEKNSFIKKEIIAIAEEIDNDLMRFSSMLIFIGNYVEQHSLDFKNESNATMLLKQFYVNPNQEYEDSKIIFTDIIWYNDDMHKIVINKNGKTDLARYFPSEGFYLKKEHNNPYLVSFSKIANSFKSEELYLFYDVLDAKEIRMGTLVLQLNFSKWLSSLKTKLNNLGYLLFLMNDNNEIVFYTKDDTQSLPDALFLKNQSIDYLDRSFVKTLKLNLHPYFLTLGYSKNLFDRELALKVMFPLIELWCCSLVFLLAFYVYRYRLKEEIYSSFEKDVNNLTLQNQTCTKEKLSLLLERSQQIEEYNKEIKQCK